MQVFMLDANMEKSAESLFDMHLRKQILECAQILCTVEWLQGNEAPYQPTHINHPIVQEAFNSLDYFIDILDYLVICLKEYEYRFDKEHKTKEVVDFFAICDTNSYFHSPRYFGPEKYRQKSVFDSYRNYYKNEKYFDKNGRNIAYKTKRKFT